jgi:hypothetical protein
MALLGEQLSVTFSQTCTCTIVAPNADHPGQSKLTVESVSVLDDTALDAALTAFTGVLPPAPAYGTPAIADGSGGTDFAAIDIDAATTGNLPVARVTGALADAPNNGTFYGRKSAAWTQAAVADVSGLSTALSAKVDASGGTLTGGTIAGATLITGTATAAGGSTVALAGASSVTVPTLAAGTRTTGAASSAFVQQELRDTARVHISGAHEFDDFLTTTSNAGDLPWHTSSNGASSGFAAINTQNFTDAHGYRSISSGTATTGRAAFSRSELTALAGTYVQPWNHGSLRLVFRVQFPVLPSLAADFVTYSFSLGTGLAVAGDHFVNGIGLRYARNVVDGWVLASRAGGPSDVASATCSGGDAVPTAATWQTIIIDMIGANATAYVGTSYTAALAAGVRATITTVGAYTGLLSPLMKANNTGTGSATARPMLVDAYGLDFDRTNSR